MGKEVKTIDQTVDNRGFTKNEGVKGRVIGVERIMLSKHLKIKQTTENNIRGYRYIYAKPEEVELDE